jgi:TPR repeat protein
MPSATLPTLLLIAVACATGTGVDSADGASTQDRAADGALRAASAHQQGPATSGAAGDEPVAGSVEALRTLRRLLSEHGRANARDLLEYARALEHGKVPGSSKRPAAAAELYAAIAAANQTGVVSVEDSGAAAVALGHLHLHGEGVPLNAARARDLFERAAATGHPDAQFALGVLYSSGFTVPVDIPLSSSYFYFAAEGGSVGAQLALGYRHLLGVNAPKSCPKVIPAFFPPFSQVISNLLSPPYRLPCHCRPPCRLLLLCLRQNRAQR